MNNSDLCEIIYNTIEEYLVHTPIPGPTDALRISRETKGVDIWFDDYKSWLVDNNISKCTKANIKSYFKIRGIKASDMTVDKIKQKF